MWHIILLLIALLLCLAASFHIGHPKVNLFPLGFAFFIAAALLPLL